MLDRQKISSLLEMIQEHTRETVGTFDKRKKYIDFNGNINKVKSKSNHLIIGRRGNGKTSLLNHVIAESGEGILNIYINMQKHALSSHSKITILIMKNILEKLLEELDKTFEIVRCETLDNSRWKQFKRYFYKRKFTDDEKSYIVLRDSIEILKNYIDELKDLPENISSKVKVNTEIKHEATLLYGKKISSELKMELGLKFSEYGIKSLSNASYTFDSSIRRTNTSSQCAEVDVQNDIKIFALLQDSMETFVRIINKVNALLDKTIFLYLDDYYQVKSECQPYILFYFHTISKEVLAKAFNIKVVTLPERIKFDLEGNSFLQPNHDIHDIFVDRELINIDEQKRILYDIVSSISGQLITPSEIKNFFNGSATEYMAIVASGGIVRDFLNLLSSALPTLISGQKSNITLVDIYHHVLDNNSNEKYSDINNEEIVKELDGLKQRIRKEIIESKKSNIFLYPKHLLKKDEKLIAELTNARYLHIIKHEIVSQNTKDKCVAFLIDLSLYVQKGGLDRSLFKEFWEKDKQSRPIGIQGAPVWHI